MQKNDLVAILFTVLIILGLGFVVGYLRYQAVSGEVNEVVETPVTDSLDSPSPTPVTNTAFLREDGTYAVNGKVVRFDSKKKIVTIKRDLSPEKEIEIVCKEGFYHYVISTNLKEEVSKTQGEKYLTTYSEFFAHCESENCSQAVAQCTVIEM